MRRLCRPAPVLCAIAVTTVLGILAAGCSDDRAAGRADAAADATPRIDVPTPPDFGLDTRDATDALGDLSPVVCDDVVTALADCPFDLVAHPDHDHCRAIECRDAPCASDDDCPNEADNGSVGQRCVAGDCVDCWTDSQCTNARLCRGGRCVDAETPDCPDVGECNGVGCGLVSVSETPCPVCVCDSLFNLACEVDADCQVISRHPFRRCLYGRCAECAGDDDCGGATCLAPGLCATLTTHPSALHGTWLLGWAGGLNHYSYFRFEPDGTLRRGRYESDNIWSDDIPQFPCWPGEPGAAPYLGTWEPELTMSGALVIRLALNVGCDSGSGWTDRFAVELFEDGARARFDEIHGDFSWDAVGMPADSCEPDFSTCEQPSF